MKDEVPDLETLAKIERWMNDDIKETGTNVTGSARRWQRFYGPSLVRRARMSFEMHRTYGDWAMLVECTYNQITGRGPGIDGMILYGCPEIGDVVYAPQANERTHVKGVEHPCVPGWQSTPGTILLVAIDESLSVQKNHVILGCRPRERDDFPRPTD